MKKYIKFVLSAMLIASLSGCGESSSNVESSDAGSVASVAESSVSKADEESSVAQKEESSTESNKLTFVNISGVRLPVDEALDRVEDVEHWATFSGSLSTSDKIYCFYSSNEIYGLFDDVPPEYTYKDAPEIFENEEKYSLKDFFNYPRSRNVESEEEVQCNGFPFIKQKGTFEVKLDDDSLHEIYFVGYYGCMYIEDKGINDNHDIPMMWMAFSEVTDEATKADMESIMDRCAAEAVFMEE